MERFVVQSCRQSGLPPTLLAQKGMWVVQTLNGSHQTEKQVSVCGIRSGTAEV